MKIGSRALDFGSIHLLGPPKAKKFLRFHNFFYNEVLFVKIGPRVLDLWLDISFGTK